ncbi:MAG: hypothetical protein Q9201_006228, partial [Fulgogasparrea decipioides]
MGSITTTDPSQPIPSDEHVDVKPTSTDSVPPFQYYANAQMEYKPPLIANGNAFLGDVFSTYHFPSSPPLSAAPLFTHNPHHLKPKTKTQNSSDLNRSSAPLTAGFYHLSPGPELVYTYTYDEMKILVEGDMQIAQLGSTSEQARGGEGQALVEGKEEAAGESRAVKKEE